MSKNIGKTNSRQFQPFFKLGRRHEERVEHGNSLREHSDLQFVFILKEEQSVIKKMQVCLFIQERVLGDMA